MVIVQIDFERLYGELYDELVKLNLEMLRISQEGEIRGLILQQKRVLEKSFDCFLSAKRECVQYEKEMDRRFPKN